MIYYYKQTKGFGASIGLIFSSLQEPKDVDYNITVTLLTRSTWHDGYLFNHGSTYFIGKNNVTKISEEEAMLEVL